MVPLNDLLENGGQLCLLTLGDQLVIAALCPNLGGSGQEDLHLCLGQHHSADIPAIHNAVILTGNLTLHIQQHITNHLVGGNQACLLGDVLGADLTGNVHAVHDHVLLAFFVILDLDGQLVDVALHTVCILGADAQKIQEICHGAVDSAGIHIAVAQLFGQGLCNGGFACTGRAVDCDIHSFSHFDVLLSKRPGPHFLF